MNKNSGQPMNIFNIITKGLLLYVRHFIPLSKVMLFPVFGQIIGILAILLPTFMLSSNITKFVPEENIAQNSILIFLTLIVTVIPGFFIFTKAFWEYMITMVSLNSMTANIAQKGYIKDTFIHNQMVKLKSREYVILLLILSGLWLLGLISPLMLLFITLPFGIPPIFIMPVVMLMEIATITILSIVSVYLSLSYQIFAFENITPIKVIKKSWDLVKDNFIRTAFLALATSIITGLIIPTIIQTILETTPVFSLISNPIKSYLLDPKYYGIALVHAVSNSGISSLMTVDPAEMLSKMFASAVVSSIVTFFVLPFGSACYTFLYLDIVLRKTIRKKK